MKKEVLILPLLLLTACAETTDEVYDSEELYVDNTEVMIEDQSAQSMGMQPIPAQHRVIEQSGQQSLQQVRISADGSVIELPAQQIIIDDVIVQAGGNNGQYASVPLPPVEPPRPAIVTLQNIAYPNTFAQCMAEDMGCIAAYEQQGYRRLNGTPQFAGYQDVLSHSDYPQGGQWRNGNNIPRW